jgi:hypothetical protein
VKILRLKMDEHAVAVQATQVGDHRTVRLTIPLPEEFAKATRSCIVMLSLDGGPPMLSQLITPGKTGDAYIKGKNVFFVLHQPHTLGRALTVQLECYSDPAGSLYICRSPVSERIIFQPSLAGNLDSTPDARSPPGVLSELAAMLPQLRELIGGDPVPRECRFSITETNLIKLLNELKEKYHD